MWPMRPLAFLPSPLPTALATLQLENRERQCDSQGGGKRKGSGKQRLRVGDAHMLPCPRARVGRARAAESRSIVGRVNGRGASSPGRPETALIDAKFPERDFGRHEVISKTVF